MVKYHEILRLFNAGISQRSIAMSCQCSRNTVAKVIKRVNELQLSWYQNQHKTDSEWEQCLFSREENHTPLRKYPNFASLHKELAHQGVSLKLLWQEYCEACRLSQEIPLMYSQFCALYQQYAQQHRVSMHIPRKPGEQIEVDWAGNTGTLMDRETGKPIPAYFFVGVLSYSQYAYVEAFLSRDLESWIEAHNHMYQYFGGVSRILVPDNLKTGVSKADWAAPVIQKSYQELAEHYNTAVIPARARKPKDKPNAEGAVAILSTWIIAALREQKWFHLSEMNQRIQEKLTALNAQPFQKKAGNRFSVFMEEEKPMLLPLPSTPYELATWKEATVQINYHIAIDNRYYSVPFEYIRHKVQVRITRHLLEIFYHDLRIGSHPRLYGPWGQYSTTPSHMPKDHQEYLSWNAERFLTWADKMGPSTHIVVQAILSAHKVEQQGYRSCLALLKLSDKYTPERLESACMKALSYTPHPSFKNVKTILSSGLDKKEEKTKSSSSKENLFGFTRGAAYYERKR